MSSRSRIEDKMLVVLILAAVLGGLYFIIWSIRSYRKEGGVITGMNWERVRDLQYSTDELTASINHKGETVMRTETVWHTRKSYRTYGSIKAKPEWPKVPEPGYRERVISAQSYYIHIRGDINKKLRYGTSDMKEWYKFRNGDRIIVTLIWSKTVYKVEPYTLEGE